MAQLEGRQALEFALELARMPTLAEAMRMHPLPPDTLVVIRIAAGCPEMCRAAREATGLKSRLIKDACTFYLQQVLFSPDSDSHRVLGVQPGASRKELREHMRWLMKWLHPDGNRDELETVFAERVLKAWRDAGSPTGRNREVVQRNDLAAPSANLSAASGFPAHRWVALPLESSGGNTKVRRITMAAAALVGMLGLALALAPAFPQVSRLLPSLGGQQDITSGKEAE